MLPVPLAGLIMARSLNGVLAVSAVASISFIYVCLKRGWRKEAICAGLLILLAGGAYALFIDHFSWKSQKESRLVVWTESVEASLQKPFFGWGFGQYSKVIPLITAPRYMSREDRILFYKEIEDPGALEVLAKKMSKGDLSYFRMKEYPGEIFLEAHNEYIEMFFAAGIPGLLLLLAAIGHTMIRGLRKKDRIPFYGFLSSCITAAFFFSWQIVPIAAVTVVWAGFCLRGDES
ncbi:MAG: hypothetical protein NTY64_15135 [Deltaproteobacteria bacterium]|nr:hypothetical protein [Deltaproteobacteria bacterium]